MASITDISDATMFNSHIESLPTNALAVVSFHTPWAAPCKQMRLILETLASSYPPLNPQTVSFLSVDAEELPDISEAYDVTAVPFLVVQRDGKVLEGLSGSDASKVRDVVERHAGKGGNAANIGLPPALESTPRSKVDETMPSKDLGGYLPGVTDSTTVQEMSSKQSSKEELNQRLAELVKAAPVMLFMKGTPSSPQCGFSRQLVGVLREKGVRYGFFNILADDDVRQGLKIWSDWPTFPQLYLQGQLIGGLDIVKEEIDSDPEFFAEYQANAKGKGFMATSEG